MTAEAQAHQALAAYSIDGELNSIRPLNRGHIHDTFVSEWKTADGTTAFIHQRMNEDVFPDIPLLMENIRRVSQHLVRELDGAQATGFEPLRLVPTANGDSFARTKSGAWRTFVFIGNTRSYDRCESPEQAFEAARAFGWFQAQLQGLPASDLGETLPSFFSSPHRFRQFQAALKEAAEDRKASAREAIEFVLERAAMVDVIEDKLAGGSIPARVVHGDTKLNNILFDEDTGKARAIVDLDTCMPGYSLYDFGDLVRFTAATSAEDEVDQSQVGTDLELYRALADGYRETAGDFLLPEEIELMPFAARLVTLTIGMRFLADHLAGDVYFKTHRPGHNLDRARVQLGMVRFMEENADAM